VYTRAFSLALWSRRAEARCLRLCCSFAPLSSEWGVGSPGEKERCFPLAEIMLVVFRVHQHANASAFLHA
jgi:hypothetical protein